jgi:dTDP-4-dehydrorhamnose reductase
LGEVVAPGRDAIDLARPHDARHRVEALSPALIINAAAYTAVDRAEGEPELANAVNAEAPGVVADAARRLGVPFVHVSTDYVFDGRNRVDADGRVRPYTETDAVNPLGVYGRSKLAGEDAIRACGGAYVILRTSWVFSRRRHNFLTLMRRLASERSELRVVDDQIGGPTWAGNLADAIAQMLAAIWAQGGVSALARHSGTYHLASTGAVSRFGFAQALFDQLARQSETPAPRLVPVPAIEFPTPAARPACSVLESAKFRQTFGLALPDWRTGLRLCLAETNDLGM